MKIDDSITREDLLEYIHALVRMLIRMDEVRNGIDPLLYGVTLIPSDFGTDGYEMTADKFANGVISFYSKKKLMETNNG